MIENKYCESNLKIYEYVYLRIVNLYIFYSKDDIVIFVIKCLVVYMYFILVLGYG